MCNSDHRTSDIPSPKPQSMSANLGQLAGLIGERAPSNDHQSTSHPISRFRRKIALFNLNSKKPKPPLESIVRNNNSLDSFGSFGCVEGIGVRNNNSHSDKLPKCIAEKYRDSRSSLGRFDSLIASYENRSNATSMTSVSEYSQDSAGNFISKINTKKRQPPAEFINRNGNSFDFVEPFERVDEKYRGSRSSSEDLDSLLACYDNSPDKESITSVSENSQDREDDFFAKLESRRIMLKNEAAPRGFFSPERVQQHRKNVLD